MKLGAVPGSFFHADPKTKIQKNWIESQKGRIGHFKGFESRKQTKKERYVLFSVELNAKNKPDSVLFGSKKRFLKKIQFHVASRCQFRMKVCIMRM
ncbi:hypothetical protein [Dubosiella muris]|uniref:Uncharacterized protein n=2 Tax=Dubosiella TaxID=1937008 RepID=A0AC61R622_9FIRM|nr:hypothetical protein [Dubosiella muris]TGY65531.1 hypothetical protein E5336_08185 [Dubosiella muris]